MQLSQVLRKASRGFEDPSRVLFPKESRQVRELLRGVPDSTSKEYYLLLLEAAREDLARTLVAKPRAGVLGGLKLLIVTRLKIRRLKALTTLAASHLTESMLREEILRR